ncbi:Tad domain-containing protein [Herminiimonas sp. CN]|uniref:Tad domain-containing protein n=1 Tax=Herminiimonas sp. CN TaxID=1349818 RepID=UPI0004735011|nr:Tad domain-containing protein [Herminiimonas sp. CN]
MRRLFIGRQHQRGAIAIIVAISIAVLIGFVGLALDLGKLYVAKTELQNSSDACALAAARELTGTSATQLTIAEAAGITTGNLNRVIFQSEPVAVNADSSVTFSQTLNGSYQPKFEGEAAKLMKYARCTVNRTSIANWFVQVLNVLPGVSIGSQAVAATAVASVVAAQTNCALPVAVCKEKLDTLNPGDWIAGALDPNGANKGSFRWIDFGDKGGGARQIKDILSGTGVCNLPAVGDPILLKPGNNNGVDDAWNTRFGLYHGGYKGPADGVPDFTGYSYTPSSWLPSPPHNAYGNFRDQRKNYAPYQGDDLTGLDIKGTASSVATHKNGANRRIDLFPVINCATFDASKQAPLASWACMLMLHPIGPQKKSDPVWSIPGEDPVTGVKMYLEYLGPSNDPSSPCATVGLPGPPDGAGPKVPVLVQ